MREFTKSLFSFSWALSMFGVQQTANLLSPDKAAKAFDSVTEATQKQFGEAIKATFNAGDALQRGTIDLTLAPFTGEVLNPSRWMRTATDLLKQSTEAVMKGAQGATSAVSQAASGVMPQQGSGTAPGTGSTGWGPMPS